MAGTSGTDDAVTGGYYGPGYRETLTTHYRSRLREYIAGFKHALLFMPKLVIADHMVVNAANFRIAYHTDATFRELFEEGLVELAHFERFKDGGPHFTLVQLRKFYAGEDGFQKGRFHPGVPREFRTSQFDAELRDMDSRISRRVADSALRDPLFTRLALANLESDRLKPLFGREYGAYRAAFNRMHNANPILGIVHFDPKRTFPGDRNIFDYMTELGSIGDRKQLIDKFGEDVGRAHRALIVRTEIELLGNVQAILPPELEIYRVWALRTADAAIIDPTQREEAQTDIDLSAVSIAALASLRRSEILDLRRRDCSQRFFDALEGMLTGKISFAQLVADLREYIDFLNGFFSNRPPVAEGRARRIKGRMRVLRGAVSTKSTRDVGIATIIQIVHLVAFSHYAFVLAQLGKVASEILDRARPTATSFNQDWLKARFELYRAEQDRESLLQYE